MIFYFLFLFRLTENETKTKLNIFADHHGIIIDSSGVELSNNNTTISDKYGIRISPRQSPLYQTMVRKPKIFEIIHIYYDIFLFSSQFMVRH